MLLTKAIQQLTSFWSVVGLSGGKREGDSRSSIRGNHMNLGGPAAAGFAAGDGDEGSLGRRPYAAERCRDGGRSRCLLPTPERRRGSNPVQVVVGNGLLRIRIWAFILDGDRPDSHRGEHERAAIHREGSQMGEEPELAGALRGFRRRRFHGTLYAGDRRTTVKDRKKEIGKGLLNKMLATLGSTGKNSGGRSDGNVPAPEELTNA